MLAHLTPAAKAAMDPVNADGRHLTAQEVLASLTALYGAPNLDVVMRKLARLEEPLTDPSLVGVQAHLALMRAGVRYLAKHSLAPPQHVLVAALITAVSSTKLADDTSAFAWIIDTWRMDNKLLAEQTFVSLATVLLDYATIKNYPAQAAPSTVGTLYGNGSRGPHETLQLKVKHDPAGGPDRVKVRTLAPHVPRPPKVFCSTHGWCSHTSSECQSPAPGHDNSTAAPTAANPDGITGCFKRN
jgi:hypothetical protein